MKTPFPSAIVIACVSLAPNLVSHAQDTVKNVRDPFASENSHGPRQVRVQVEHIEVPHERFTELMFGAKSAANDAELRKQLARLIKDGKASIMETMLCTARDGQKAHTESIEEFIFPTEYEPARPAGLPLTTAETLGNPPQPIAQMALEATGPLPTAFETRNLGSTWEIEDNASANGKLVDLRSVPEIVYHTGNTVWGEWKAKHGNFPVQMPDIHTLRFNTAATLATGKPLLIAALTSKDDKGGADPSRKLMVFVKADVFDPGELKRPWACNGSRSSGCSSLAAASRARSIRLFPPSGSAPNTSASPTPP